MTSLIDSNPAILPSDQAIGLADPKPGKSPLARRDDRAARKPNFPTSYRGTILTGGMVILASFGGLATWSAVAPLSTAAIASGTVVVDSFRKSVQHLQGGIIQDILVRDGQHVEAG